MTQLQMLTIKWLSQPTTVSPQSRVANQQEQKKTRDREHNKKKRAREVKTITKFPKIYMNLKVIQTGNDNSETIVSTILGILCFM